MAEYLKFWLAKFLVEHGIALIFLAVLVIIIVVLTAERWLKQFRCRHDGALYETRACDAICMKCGKNLGFIGSVKRDRP